MLTASTNSAINQLASFTLVLSDVSGGRLTVKEMMSGDRNTAIGNTPSGDSNSFTFKQQQNALQQLQHNRNTVYA